MTNKLTIDLDRLREQAARDGDVLMFAGGTRDEILIGVEDLIAALQQLPQAEGKTPKYSVDFQSIPEDTDIILIRDEDIDHESVMELGGFLGENLKGRTRPLVVVGLKPGATIQSLTPKQMREMGWRRVEDGEYTQCPQPR